MASAWIIPTIPATPYATRISAGPRAAAGGPQRQQQAEVVDCQPAGGEQQRVQRTDLLAINPVGQGGLAEDLRRSLMAVNQAQA
jgi:hypothetical protein